VIFPQDVIFIRCGERRNKK